MSKRISVIVPCYNVEKYIVRCLESLVNQTIGLEKIEIILVNDASNDNTLQHLLDYEKKYPENIIVIDCKENKRQGGARNIGLTYATGDYIAFVDSDDFVESTMYEEMYVKAVQYDCDIVLCRFVREYNEGNNVEYKILTGEPDALYDITSDAEREDFIVSDHMGSSACDKLYKRNLIYDNNIWFPEGMAYEDHYWGAMFYLYTKSIYVLEKNLYHYCANWESTILKMNMLYHFDLLKVNLIKWQEYEKRGMIQKYKNALEYDFIRAYYYMGLKMLFLRFTYPSYQVFLEIKKCVLNIVPDYKNNVYIYSRIRENLMWCIDILDKDISEDEFLEISSYVSKNGLEKK